MFLFSEMVCGGLTVRRRGKGVRVVLKLSLCLASWHETTRVSVSAHVHFSDHIHVQAVDVVSLTTGTDGKKKENCLCAWHYPLEKLWGGAGE